MFPIPDSHRNLPSRHKTQVEVAHYSPFHRHVGLSGSGCAMDFVGAPRIAGCSTFKNMTGEVPTRDPLEEKSSNIGKYVKVLVKFI